MLFFDFETHLIEPGRVFPPVVCGAFQADDGKPLLRDRGQSLDYLSTAIETEHLCGHYVAFDLGCLGASWPDLLPAIFQAYDQDRVTCTQARQKLIDTGMGCLDKLGPYTLANLAKRCLDLDLDKGADTWRLRYSELDGVPLEAWPDEARAYPLLDAAVTAAVYQAQEPYSRFLVDQHRQARADFALSLTAAWGLVPDQTKVDVWERATRGELDALEDICRAAGFIRPNGSRDLGAVRARVSQEYGTGAPTTPSGAVSTDAATCTDSGDPVLRAFGDLGKIRPRIDKDLPILRRSIVHTRYGFAASGRSTSRDPNVQNFGRRGGVRECFAPRPGFLYFGADFSTVELATLAQACLDLFGRSPLAAALNAGEDPHLSLAATVLGIEYAECVARYKAHDPAAREARQVCKVANFGYPGGLGAGAFVGYAHAQGVEIDAGRADALKRQWLERWDLREFFRFVAEIADGSGEMVQLRSGRIRGRVGFTDGCNTLFQGLASDLGKDALYRVTRACYSPGPLYGAKPVLFVHDSIDGEALEDVAAEAAEELSRIMVETAREWLPGVKVKAEPYLARFMSKGVETVRDQGGRLVPWEG